MYLPHRQQSKKAVMLTFAADMFPSKLLKRAGNPIDPLPY
jgi:hypothetical protein